MTHFTNPKNKRKKKEREKEKGQTLKIYEKLYKQPSVVRDTAEC